MTRLGYLQAGAVLEPWSRWATPPAGLWFAPVPVPVRGARPEPEIFDAFFRAPRPPSDRLVVDFLPISSFRLPPGLSGAFVDSSEQAEQPVEKRERGRRTPRYAQ